MIIIIKTLLANMFIVIEKLKWKERHVISSHQIKSHMAVNQTQILTQKNK